MSQRGSAAVAVAALAQVLAAGCATQIQPSVDFSASTREYLPTDYPDVYKRWTRHDYAQHGVDKALEVWATFKSWDFREAYVEKYSAIYNLPEAERAALRQAQRDAYEQTYEFHVIAQSADYVWNDLEKSSSAWRVALVDAAGHELEPDRIRVEKLPDAYESVFFPGKTPFSKSYRISFPVPAAGGDFAGVSTGAITLRIDSPLGRVQLVWRHLD